MQKSQCAWRRNPPISTQNISLFELKSLYFMQKSHLICLKKKPTLSTQNICLFALKSLCFMQKSHLMCLKKKPTHLCTEHLFIDSFTTHLLTPQFRLSGEKEEEQRKNDTQVWGENSWFCLGIGAEQAEEKPSVEIHPRCSPTSLICKTLYDLIKKKKDLIKNPVCWAQVSLTQGPHEQFLFLN